MRYHDPTTFATHPGGFKLNTSRLWALDPWGSSKWGRLWITVSAVGRLKEHMTHGDTRAALVVGVNPLLVAAYSDEIDGVAMLRFPDHIQQTFNLHIGDRLLTVNTYVKTIRLAPDLIKGDHFTKQYTNFHPVIADFLTDDTQQLERCKAAIPAEEWERCAALAAAYQDQLPNRSRNGIPRRSMRPSRRREA